MTKNDLIELILFFTYLTLTMNVFFAISIILALVEQSNFKDSIYE